MRTANSRHCNNTIALVLIAILICACGGQQAQLTVRKAAATREIGEAYMRQGDYTAALRELTKAKEMNPEDPIVYFDLGVCYMTKKKLPDAIANFKRAIDLKPSYGPARNNLGTAYLAAEEWDAAIAIFDEISQDALYGTPHYPQANLGLAYYHKGDYRKAIGHYKKALKISPIFVIALRGAGRTYLAMNRGRLAHGYLERALKLAPQVPEIHYDYAEANLLMGRINQARVSYQTVIDLAAPESDLTAKAKQRLRSIR